MEERDLELIRRYSNKDKALSELYQEHLDLERELESFNNRAYLSPTEEMERKTIQKKKLLGRDRMESILRKYREREKAS
jgi:uncharacterized protein YdcH (DUF465 family)